jgi:hypothetical protein
MGATKTISGAGLSDFPVQWQRMGLPDGEWVVWSKQHIMGMDADSQAIPQARGASGSARTATTTMIAWARCMAKA